MIHQTAIIHPKAKLHPGVTVGAYSIIGADVEIGENTEVGHHATIEGPTVIGPGSKIFPYAAIGFDPQDKKYRGERSQLIIGKENTIREFVTINRGTEDGGGITQVGDRCWIMAYCHIAHDCIVGNDVIFSNNTTLGGHVTIGNNVVAGGFSAIHQFCSIGDYAMTGAHTMIAQNVVPYVIASGNRVRVVGINKTGLERNGFSKEKIKEIQRAYKIFFNSALSKVEALDKLEKEYPSSPEITFFIDFIKNSERGICR